MIFNGVVASIFPANPSAGHKSLPDNAARTIAYFEIASKFSRESRVGLFASLDGVADGLRAFLPSFVEVGVDDHFLDRMVNGIAHFKQADASHHRQTKASKHDIAACLHVAYVQFREEKFVEFGKEVGKLAKHLGRKRHELRE